MKTQRVHPVYNFISIMFKHFLYTLCGSIRCIVSLCTYKLKWEIISRYEDSLNSSDSSCCHLWRNDVYETNYLQSSRHYFMRVYVCLRLLIRLNQLRSAFFPSILVCLISQWWISILSVELKSHGLNVTILVSFTILYVFYFHIIAWRC